MILLPIHKKLDWKNPPIVTLLLIVLNVAIFLIFQLNDDQERSAALNYYQHSGLGAIELPAAMAYAERTGSHELSYALADISNGDFPYWVLYLQTDSNFYHALHSGEVITQDVDGYEEWQRKRAHFEELYEAITYVGYGLRTDNPSLTTLFSHMFLHAGFWHLFGNMLFLLAVGMLVETTIDRRSYLIAYLLGGLGSATFDFIFRIDSLIPGIGASGAIAGLMGAYAVLYGLKKIRFFYYIGVYFDYAKMPAIILLPLWVGNELLQMHLYADSGVNFLAHLGGLCSGALIAVFIRKKVTSYNLEFIEEEERLEQLAGELRRVRALMNDFKLDEARPRLRRLRSRHPQNREVLARYYECNRIKPANEEYHATAHAIFALTESDGATDALVLETFNDYRKLARPSIRMSPALVCALARRFIRQQALTEAEQLVRIILVKKIDCPKGSALMQAFIRMLEVQGRTEALQRYRKLAQVAEGA